MWYFILSTPVKFSHSRGKERRETTTTKQVQKKEQQQNERKTDKKPTNLWNNTHRSWKIFKHKTLALPNADCPKLVFLSFKVRIPTKQLHPVHMPQLREFRILHCFAILVFCEIGASKERGSCYIIQRRHRHYGNKMFLTPLSCSQEILLQMTYWLPLDTASAVEVTSGISLTMFRNLCKVCWLIFPMLCWIFLLKLKNNNNKDCL